MKLYLCYAMRDLRLTSVLQCGEKDRQTDRNGPRAKKFSTEGDSLARR